MRARKAFRWIVTVRMGVGRLSLKISDSRTFLVAERHAQRPSASFAVLHNPKHAAGCVARDEERHRTHDLLRPPLFLDTAARGEKHMLLHLIAA